jgi:hypothetical protein
MTEQKSATPKVIVPTAAQTKRFVELSRHVAHFKVGNSKVPGFKVWGREEDVPRAKQLLNKILDEEEKALITPHQAYQLAAVVSQWIAAKEEFFASEEYRMRQMTNAFDVQEQRNGKHIAEEPFDKWLDEIGKRAAAAKKKK